MQVLIIIALLIAIVAVLFALQNLTTVTVTFLFWSIQASLALVLLITLAAGVLISVLASLPGLIRGKLTLSSQKKKLSVLETERNTYRLQAEEAQKDVKAMEEQLASFSAALEKDQPDSAVQIIKPS